MFDQELNNTINDLWAQLPQDQNLDEKFYAYILMGKVEKFKELIAQYPLMKEIAITDQSILYGPAFRYNSEMIEYLVTELSLNVDIRRQENLNTTLLMEVLDKHHTEHRDVNISDKQKFEMKCRIVETLVGLGADINAQDYIGRTPLQCAIPLITIDDLVYKNAYALLELLLKKGANPNVQNHRGLTSLHLLFVNEKAPLFLLKPLVQLLIKFGADENIADKTGLTPKIMILQRAPVARVAKPPVP